MFVSSTEEIPQASEIPQHIAIIMDGNGRWAKKHFLPRVAGHKRGVETVRDAVKSCVDIGVRYLTLFAFSSENWRRPSEEVSVLMQLFIMALEQEVAKLHENGVCLKVIGDINRFEPRLIELIEHAQQLTSKNSRLVLTIAANYGGRWDIIQALQRMLAAHPECKETFDESLFASFLSMNYAPEPDLFIRTGGEQRISNFLLWQLAYTEFYFTDTLWPDFDRDALNLAIASYQKRERRFGRTSEQIVETAKNKNFILSKAIVKTKIGV